MIERIEYDEDVHVKINEIIAYLNKADRGMAKGNMETLIRNDVPTHIVKAMIESFEDPNSLMEAEFPGNDMHSETMNSPKVLSINTVKKLLAAGAGTALITLINKYSDGDPNDLFNNEWENN